MRLEEQLGYFFFDKQLLKRSLTTPAYALEQLQLPDDQQAFSVLGSAVLDTVLTELLIRQGHNSQRAIVTQKLVLKQIENLARISQTMGIGYVLNLSQAEKERQAYDDPIVLVEGLEAVIGGIYFDGGFAAARRSIQRLFQDVFSNEC
jgi:ribonuclease-3